MSAYGLTRNENVELLVRTALEYGVTDPRQIAYILATAQHESDNFKTAREYNGRGQALRLGYSGGADYYGRGYVQVTHDHRYDTMATVLGDSRISRDPDVVAREPRIGSQTTVVGMVRGLYTGVGLDQFINDNRKDYVGARAVVNGSDQAIRIAGYAEQWEHKVPELAARVARDGLVPRVMPGSPMSDGSLRRGEMGPEVRRLQEALVRDGAGMKPDGNYGRGTKAEVEAYQRRHDVPVTGVADRQMLKTLGVEPQQGKTGAAGNHSQTSPDEGGANQADASLHQKLREQVRALDQQAGKPWDDASERLAASALVMAKGSGFTAHDELRLAFNHPTERHAGGEILHLARQGPQASPDPAANRAHMATMDALAVPAEDRLRQVEALDAQRTQLQAERLSQAPEPNVEPRSGPALQM